MLRQYMKHIKSIHLAQEASQSKNPKLGIFSISHLVVILYDRVPLCTDLQILKVVRWFQHRARLDLN